MDLEAHPGCQKDPALQRIINHYRGLLSASGIFSLPGDSKINADSIEKEIDKIITGLKYSLQEYDTYEQDSIEAYFPGLRFREQYNRQLDIALESGMFESEPGVQNLGNGKDFMCEFPYIDRFDRHFRMPGWGNVKNLLLKYHRLIQKKSTQSFTKLLIVPFGYDLKILTGHFTGIFRRIDKEKGIYDSKGNKIIFQDGFPFVNEDTFNEKSIIYHPQNYERKKHGGLSKEDAIKEDGVWQICLMEDMPLIPREIELPPNLDHSKDIIGERPRLDINGDFLKCHADLPDPNNKTIKRLNDFINTQGKNADSPYFAERGITAEVYFWLILSGLLNPEKAVLWDIDDSKEGPEISKVVFTESYVRPMYHIPGMDSFQNDGSRIYRFSANRQTSSKDIGTRTRVVLK